MNEQIMNCEMNETALDDINGGCGCLPIIRPFWPIRPIRPIPPRPPRPFPWWRPIFFKK